MPDMCDPCASSAPEDSLGPPLDSDETLVGLRCSEMIFRQDDVLLLHRLDPDEWVLPGGRPRPGESLVSCARREVQEETGLEIVPGRCVLVLEVAAPDCASRTVELVFLGAPIAGEQCLHGGEPGRRPTWVPLTQIRPTRLRPPVGGHLRALAQGGRGGAAYLGNVWRPAETGDAGLGVAPVGWPGDRADRSGS